MIDCVVHPVVKLFVYLPVRIRFCLLLQAPGDLFRFRRSLAVAQRLCPGTEFLSSLSCIEVYWGIQKPLRIDCQMLLEFLPPLLPAIRFYPFYLATSNIWINSLVLTF